MTTQLCISHARTHIHNTYTHEHKLMLDTISAAKNPLTGVVTTELENLFFFLHFVIFIFDSVFLELLFFLLFLHTSITQPAVVFFFCFVFYLRSSTAFNLNVFICCFFFFFNFFFLSFWVRYFFLKWMMGRHNRHGWFQEEKKKEYLMVLPFEVWWGRLTSEMCDGTDGTLAPFVGPSSKYKMVSLSQVFGERNQINSHQTPTDELGKNTSWDSPWRATLHIPHRATVMEEAPTAAVPPSPKKWELTNKMSTASAAGFCNTHLISLPFLISVVPLFWVGWGEGLFHD